MLALESSSIHAAHTLAFFATDAMLLRVKTALILRRNVVGLSPSATGRSIMLYWMVVFSGDEVGL